MGWGDGCGWMRWGRGAGGDGGLGHGGARRAGGPTRGDWVVLILGKEDLLWASSQPRRG